MEANFQNYLLTKKSIDDRSINEHVWQSLIREMERSNNDPKQFLEIGAGIGTMVQRLFEGLSVPTNLSYTCLDFDEQNIRYARNALVEWSQKKGYQISSSGDSLILSGIGKIWEIRFLGADIFTFLGLYDNTDKLDVIIAHAFLDLVNVPRLISELKKVTHNNSLYYFTLNFDGVTILEPVQNKKFEEKVFRLYHRSMDLHEKNTIVGGSQTGRKLFHWLKDASLDILDAGSSDWVVFPSKYGYTEEERTFLDYFIRMIQNELSRDAGIDHGRFERWVESRQEQIDNGELFLIVHQLDYLAQNIS